MPFLSVSRPRPPRVTQRAPFPLLNASIDKINNLKWCSYILSFRRQARRTPRIGTMRRTLSRSIAKLACDRGRVGETDGAERLNRKR